MNKSGGKVDKESGGGVQQSSQKEEEGQRVPPHSEQPSSDDFDKGSNQGENLRRALGLTATVSSKTSDACLSDPYTESCLEAEGEADDSLIQLAKHTFRKLSSSDKWSPTPIQLQSWPILKSKSKSKSKSKKESSQKNNNLNLMAIATTGSGKTLSYSIPMVDSCALVKGKKSRRYVHGLVLVPTRELALQVFKTLQIVTKTANKLSGKSDKIMALAIYGGINREEQIDSLGKNSQFIVAATPLRLIDLLGIGSNDSNGKESVPNESIQRLFESTRYLVIDEADQMATKSDMSQQVDLIINFLREKSSKLEKECLFSATLPRRAIGKCNDWIHQPRATIKVDTVTVGADDSAKGSADVVPSCSEEKDKKAADRRGPLDLSIIPAHITQTLHVCANHKKPKKLMTTIDKVRKAEKEGGNKRSRGLLIIFFGRIKTLQYVHGLLQKDKIQGVALHSQMNQKKRESQLNLFRSGKCPILLATDVAARGIHIKNVEYIINYDFPGSLEQYVHRCGRAGRSTVSGRAGDDKKEKSSNATVYSFFNRELAPMAKDVLELLRSCNAWVDPNLIALLPEDAKQDTGDSKRKRRKRGKNANDEGEALDAKSSAAKKKKPDVDDSNIMDDSEDEFAHLAPNRIVLKRASHVPDSDSEDESDSE
mmetsp:Transcript_23996/g.66495  ORF Transcript_23996/g.66495 Transcript_23996/m.66495 type:complete len:653 (-) Transcript_23996:199-2157(-)